MTKLESIQFLDSIGLNTPRLWRVFNGPLAELRSCVSLPERISIRTQKPGAYQCPHHPNVSRDRFIPVIKDLRQKGFQVLIFEAIDPQKCLIKGNLVVTPDNRWMFEFISGPGTVRSLEKLKPAQRTYPGGIGIPQELRAAYLASRKFDMAGKILEWSVYSEPVGKLHQPDIYWELRPWT